MHIDIVSLQITGLLYTLEYWRDPARGESVIAFRCGESMRVLRKARISDTDGLVSMIDEIGANGDDPGADTLAGGLVLAMLSGRDETESFRALESRVSVLN